ncbi:uncharacterized protein LOC143284868 [Babylonia areolata]|uniref:uncharacterized protein LOC143284868 n=1 Tax=Babylonia areolata TaxID=304850 RepID=UPI003FD05474
MSEEGSGGGLGQGVDEEEVGQMKAGQIFQLAARMQLSLAGCNNVDQFRERVLLHLRAQRGRHFDLQREFHSRPGEGADSTRRVMDGLLESVQTAIANLTPTLEHALRTDSGGSDQAAPLVQQIHRRRRSLLKSDCTVIVAGETNAGKSTFLNLLLGMDVLPTSIFSCTAAACVLRYSHSFRAHVHSRDGTRSSQEMADSESTKEWLDSRVAEQNLDKRQEGLDIHAVHIEMPATILQSGVTLVDTPGIGENEAMTQCTMDYVKRHSAAAYIYVIKTDNAGGVHDDRLLDFLRAILAHNEQTRSAGAFNPSAAMFVCNRWDQVERNQRQGVKDNVLQKLKDVWPKFEPQQAFFMSSTNAQMHFDLDPRYITEDFEQVLRGLKDMYVKARHNNVNQHYRWLKQFLHSSTGFLQTAVHHCALSDEQLIECFKLTRDKLTALQQHTSTTTQHMRQHVRHAIQDLCGQMKAILQDEEVRAELLEWSKNCSLPGPPSGGNERDQWGVEVDTRIMRKVLDIVDRQVQVRGLADTLHTSIRTLFHQELKLVDEDMNSILTDLKSDTASLCSSTSSNSSSTCSDTHTGEAQELLRLYQKRDGFRLQQLKHVSRVTRTLSNSSHSPEATVANVPKVLVSRLLGRMLGPLTTLVGTMQKRRRVSLFEQHPQQYMKERMEKMVRVICDSDNLMAQLAAKYHEKMDSFISDVESSIPMFIANNQQKMEDIKVNRRKYLAQRKELTSLMEHLEPVRHMLQDFGAYIRDLTADNIFYALDANQRGVSVAVKVQDKGAIRDSGLGESKLDRSRRASGGWTARSWAPSMGASLWSMFRKGHVTIGSQKKDVIGKTYLQPPAEQYLIKETARLRCLRCEDLAHFLGMTRMEDQAVFLFLGDLKSARRFLLKGFHNPCDSVPRLLEGVFRGLYYLHREGLVHMELSLDTIMVNEEGDPRLCGACLPRYARLPPDADLICADPFVCLSPEVLRDELYTAEDDVYSFGLLVWETCLQEKPYRQFRATLSLQQFRTQVHPSSMLGLEACSHVSDTMAAILRGCLYPARGLRIKMDELKEHVSTLRSDPMVLSLSAAHRRAYNKPMRRASSDDHTISEALQRQTSLHDDTSTETSTQ